MATALTSPDRTKRSQRPRDLHRMNVGELFDLAERLNGQPVPGVRMTETEFLQWCDEELRAEWVNGRVILMPPVSDAHDDLDTWLIALIRLLAEEQDLGVVRQDMFVRLSGQRRLRVPDVMFISKERLQQLKPTFLDGAPDLVIEIISPDSQSRDRREKFGEYEKAGVREYWIIDPLSQTVEVYRLERRKFVLVETEGDAVASSVLPKLKLKVSMFWQKPLPKIMSLVRHLGGR